MDLNFIDDMTRRITALLPPGVQLLQRDLERNIQSALQAGFGRLDLVTREEFEVQSQVLARTRAQLDTLHERVRDLEDRLHAQQQVSRDE